jgi:peptide/nickel transport system ATP-binding protein
MRLRGETLPWSAAKRTADVRRLIQYIFQSPHGSLNPRKSVRQLVEQPIKHFGLGNSDDQVPGLLERVSLSPRFARRYPSQLSGGECQRVAIARALAALPEVLICDEITSALDVSVQASILELLAELHEQTDLTVLFVTHNLGVVRAIADTVVVLDRGVIVEEGPVDRVLDAPQDPYTKSLLKDTPRFEQPPRPQAVARDTSA